MSYKLLVSIQAHADTINAIDYYDSINPNLGDRFLIELMEVYKKITYNPTNYSFIATQRKFRDVKLKIFPYVVIFEINGTDIIISAVLNTHKLPIIR
jgi:hypothetical protein